MITERPQPSRRSRPQATSQHFALEGFDADGRFPAERGESVARSLRPCYVYTSFGHEDMVRRLGLVAAAAKYRFWLKSAGSVERF
jgi:hypothetical protein